MLGRRSSTVTLVDEWLPYPSHTSAPGYSTFLSPEGSYTLAYEVLPPPPPTPIGSGNNNAAAALAAAHALQEHPATFVTAIVTFPPITQSSGLLGLGSSQKTTRAREASFSTDASSFSPLTQNASLGPSDEASSSTSTNSLQDSGPGSSQMQSMLGQSPVAGKRRPLMSLPSMPSMPLSSFGNNSGQASTPLTSKPKNAFRGTTSTFVKSYEGLPLSARVDKLWAGQDAREVTLAAFTCGKTVFISDISLRAKSRVSPCCLDFARLTELIYERRIPSYACNLGRSQPVSVSTSLPSRTTG